MDEFLCDKELPSTDLSIEIPNFLRDSLAQFQQIQHGPFGKHQDDFELPVILIFFKKNHSTSQN